MRLMSKIVEVTHNRGQAEKHVNVNIVGLHSQAQAAQLAAEGQYTKARMMQKTNMRMVRRTMATGEATESQTDHYGLWNQEALRLNSALKSTKIAEKNEGLHYHSAEEDNSGSEDEKEKIGDDNDETVVEKGSDEKEQKERKDRKQKREEVKHKRAAVKEQREQERKQRRTRNDGVSNVLYQAQNPLFSNFTSAANPLYSATKEK